MQIQEIESFELRILVSNDDPSVYSMTRLKIDTVDLMRCKVTLIRDYLPLMSTRLVGIFFLCEDKPGYG